MAHWLLGGGKTLSESELVELIRRYVAGDKQAGEDVIRGVAGVLCGVVYDSVSDRDIRDDVLSELVMIVLSCLASYDASRAKVATFVRAIAKRNVQRVASWYQNQSCGGLGLDVADSESWCDPSILYSAVAKLPVEQSQVVIGRLNGESKVDMASRLGYSMNKLLRIEREAVDSLRSTIFAQI